jgi:hypothetical protein
MRKVIVLSALVLLTACGGNRAGRGNTQSATGEVSRACLAADRAAANPALCGCAQAAANQTLRGSDMSRAASFFGDPDRAQEARTADDSSTEAFWQRYRSFVDQSRAMCG